MAKRRLGREEQRAWARVIRSVRPLTGSETTDPSMLSESENAAKFADMIENGVDLGPAPSSSVPYRASPGRQSPAYPTPLKSPAKRDRERRIRRGQVPIAARFDLHGHTQDSAARALPGFLSSARDGGARCVLIITGKGRLGEGVLRRQFLLWLESTAARAIVSGYSEAHARHGGAGAFYVFLRRL